VFSFFLLILACTPSSVLHKESITRCLWFWPLVACKPAGLLLCAVSVRAGESQELIFLVSNHIRWQSQELIFPCLSALAVWFLLVSQSSRSWIPEPQVPDFFLPRADFWCKSSIPARVPWICPSVRFWRSVRSFVLPPKEWLPAIAMPDLDFQVLLLLTHA
jgi:hypothetical protein